jgi:hypothetical protein
MLEREENGEPIFRKAAEVGDRAAAFERYILSMRRMKNQQTLTTACMASPAPN